jgi:hypothetical protein
MRRRAHPSNEIARFVAEPSLANATGEPDAS